MWEGTLAPRRPDQLGQSWARRVGRCLPYCPQRRPGVAAALWKCRTSGSPDVQVGKILRSVRPGSWRSDHLKWPSFSLLPPCRWQVSMPGREAAPQGRPVRVMLVVSGRLAAGQVRTLGENPRADPEQGRPPYTQTPRSSFSPSRRLSPGGVGGWGSQVTST